MYGGYGKKSGKKTPMKKTSYGTGKKKKGKKK